eukprot:CAMPEP_0172408944 /NCGR_PEP_ID=MMETSP1061-20121228/76115_1 /TAXON_ID=37318 /ORGANISM="Pseudo-nitzschia pungens, Strain cf. pungens" /LENGTH=388 /DNA_ID=CAMNT_0013145089 /DNA_START=63 /DNA_END=1229 /DNA_ORIENTATION=-
MYTFPTVVLLTALLLSSRVTNGQDVGSEICSCSPSSYEFQLDFSLECPPVNITIGNAIQATSCLVSPFGNLNVNNLIPVAVESIDILELGQSLRVIAQTKIDDKLVDGESFMYQSAFATPEDVGSAEKVVRALQVNMVGINSDGDRVISVFIVTFTNGCGSYPVFEKGQSAGWTRFVGFGQASPGLCAAASERPTPSPTEAPTNAPIIRITPSPSDAIPAPVSTVVALDPTGSPTQTEIQTNAPTVPLPVETKAPTKAPTNEPSQPPTKVQTKAPTNEPSQPPTEVPTKAPTNKPSQPPTEVPTKAPDSETSSPSTKVTSINSVVETKTDGSSANVPSPSDSPLLLPEDTDFSSYMSMSMSMRVDELLGVLPNRELGTRKSLRGVRGE